MDKVARRYITLHYTTNQTGTGSTPRCSYSKISFLSRVGKLGAVSKLWKTMQTTAEDCSVEACGCKMAGEWLMRLDGANWLISIFTDDVSGLFKL